MRRRGYSTNENERHLCGNQKPDQVAEVCQCLTYVRAAPRFPCVALQNRRHASGNPRSDSDDIPALGCMPGIEPWTFPVRGCGNAVEDQDMKMGREIQSAAEPLDESHRSALSSRNTALPRLPFEPREHGPDKDTQDLPQQRGIEGHTVAQRERQRQHPLPHRHVRNHAVH